ncbi:MAG: hypothetical protein F6K42_08040, partial [Leptolyngbya sp. SIO1D8]|nr:hypothetical protein [Leptolyngbya sp. SIO1D8]
QQLLDSTNTPVVRLLPSLWFGETHTTATFVDMMSTPICWAEVGAVETAIKQLWAEMLGARSLAYWEHWLGTVAEKSHPYPERIGLAIVIQAVEPVQLSGTLTIRTDSITIQAVRGLPKAMLESFPDSYHGPLPETLPLNWQPGYQDQLYQPVSNRLPDSQLAPCLSTTEAQKTALEVMLPETEQALLQVARQLQKWAAQPLRVEWLWPLTPNASLAIAQALGWPLLPSSPKLQMAASRLPRELMGYAASPGQVVGTALVIKPGEGLPTMAPQQIIVASEVAPDWLPLLKTAAAVVSEKGGLTCHAAILARELQLPAVVGLIEATHQLQTGDLLHLDGDRGLVEILTTPPSAIASAPKTLPDLTALESQTQIWLNLSQPDMVADLAALPVAGVGLLRSEWLMIPILDRQHPYQWLKNGQREILLERLTNQLRPIVQAFAPRPVHYRSLDVCSNEFAQLEGAPALESNPVLGIRGAFSYQQYPDFFQLELEVLQQLQSEGLTNLQLLLPFVRTVEEVQYCQTLIRAVGLDQHPLFELWIMAEVPSVLFLMSDYVAAGIQGIALGTNDLIQLLLGVDRDQPLLSAYFNERHSAVQAAIAQLIQQAQTLNIPCILCGVAAAHDPSFISDLVRQGITGISVDAAAIAAIVKEIQQTENT